MREKPLSAVAEVIAGQSPPSSTYNQDKVGVPFFQGKADFNDLYPTVRYWCSIPKKMSKPNDILFSLRAPVGPTNLNNIDACIGRGLAAIRVKENTSLSYVLHYLRANEEKIASLGTGSTFKAIKVGDLKSLQIPLPPLPTQKKIAAILGEADAYRQKTKALIAKYDELSQSLFLDMFGDTRLNKKGFHQNILGECLEFITYGLTVRPTYIENGVRLISAREIRSGKLDLCSGPQISESDFKELSEKGKPQKGEILFSKTGSIGHSAIIDTDEKFAITQNAARLVFKQSVHPIFALEQLRTDYFQTLCQRRAKGNAVKDLQLGDMKKLPFISPPLKLQNQFAERVEAIEAQKAQAQQELVKAEELFGSLLQGAFKGELV